MDNHALHPNPCLSISIGWRKRGQWLYRISKEVEELGWVDFDYDVPLILMLLCSSSLNRADSGTAKTKANSTQVRDLFGHPVESLRAMRMSAILICPTSNNRVILCYYGHANPRVKLSCFLPDIRIPHSNKTVHNIPHVQLRSRQWFSQKSYRDRGAIYRLGGIAQLRWRRRATMNRDIIIITLVIVTLQVSVKSSRRPLIRFVWFCPNFRRRHLFRDV